MAALQILRAEEYVNNYCCYATLRKVMQNTYPLALNKSCQDKAHRNFRQKINQILLMSGEEKPIICSSRSFCCE